MAAKIKVLYVITKGNWGGAQKYVYDLATNLPPTEYEPVVALGEGEELEQKLDIYKIRVLKLPRSIRDIKFLTDIGLFFDLIDLFRQEQPQVVHLNSSKIGAVGAVAARIAKVPRIIFTAHGWAFNEERPDWQKALIWFAHWLTIVFCHQVITISEREYQQALKMLFAQNKIAKIHNGLQAIDFLNHSQARKELISYDSRLTKHYDSLWLGTISELHRNKGVDYIIEAIADLKIRFGAVPILVVIGEGEERKNLEKLIAEKDLNDNIFLLGKIENAKTLLKAFDIFTLTSRKEGLPFALLEAGLAELPVLAADVGGISEIINSAEVGTLVRPNQPKEISLALQKILADLPAYQSRARALRARVSQNFSFEQMLEKTINLYK